MNLALGFGGDFFTIEGDEVTFEAGEAEMEVPRRIHALTYEAGVLDPVTLTLSGGDTMPGFIGGDYALWAAPDFWAQQLVASAPEDLNWIVLPPLAGPEGATQAANPQTLSVPIDSEHPEEAAAFISFVMEAENLAALAQGDWLIPASGGGAGSSLGSHRRGGRMGPDPRQRRVPRSCAVPVRRRLSAVEGPDRHAGVAGVLRRQHQLGGPAGTAHRRLEPDCR